jgi:hypothetical protein
MRPPVPAKLIVVEEINPTDMTPVNKQGDFYRRVKSKDKVG